MSKFNKNKSGYKKTKIGWIPEDWELKNLGDCLKGKPQYGINAASVEYSDNLPTYIRITDISEDGKFIPEKKVSVDKPDSSKYLLTNNDILFARTGATTGKSYLYNPNDGELIFAGFLIRVKTDQGKLYAQYLKNYTETHIYWTWVSLMSKRSGQPGINGVEYAQLPVPLPPLPEQKKIAEILSTWDIAIEKTEKLIEVKQKLKKGLMQKLLTGKVRFKKFGKNNNNHEIHERHEKGKGKLPDGWKEILFNDIFFFLKSYSFTRDDLRNKKENNDAIFCIHYGDIHNNSDKLILDFNTDNFISILNTDKTNMLNNDFLQDGDLIIADASEDYQGVGQCIELKNVVRKKVIAGLHTIAVRSKDSILFNGFKAYLMNYETIRNQLRRIATGVSVYGISKSNILKISIRFPESIKEQKRIASVLSTADKEIELLNKKLEALKQQKKGLMQKLLTGKIRVHVRAIR